MTDRSDPRLQDESRLDAVVLRAGLARTIAQARQTVVHRHVLVDGARVEVVEIEG